MSRLDEMQSSPFGCNLNQVAIIDTATIILPSDAMHWSSLPSGCNRRRRMTGSLQKQKESRFFYQGYVFKELDALVHLKTRNLKFLGEGPARFPCVFSREFEGVHAPQRRPSDLGAA